MIHAQLYAVLSKNELLLERLPDGICNLFCFTLLHGYGWVVKEDYTKVINNFLMERASNTGNDACMTKPEEHALKFGRFLKSMADWNQPTEFCPKSNHQVKQICRQLFGCDEMPIIDQILPLSDGNRTSNSGKMVKW
ncbi:hypothetical protein HPP92_001963 [Vanilla planifolia]|uniref:Uncharacterized protein n=1 Tax=Vanilla planifolia TaxID=51239 RepID=A0A835RVG9_VANPL|nr:hypothetical protein HPP92_002224 [Vanilla planifolia]KAG0501891.1 hypothetical protein HPP92_001963 [Vanilla planifolia]